MASDPIPAGPPPQGPPPHGTPPRRQLRARIGRRGLAFAALVGVVAIVAVSMTRLPLAPTPSPSPGSSAGASSAPTDEPMTGLFPTPATVDVVLLVGSADALSEPEQRWLDDLRSAFGRVDTLAYAGATADRLAAYFTIFITDQSLELDVNAVISAYVSGRTVHLVGPTAAYRSSIAGANR